MILPNCSVNTATEIAERLRTAVAQHDFTTVGKLHISLGVAEWPLHEPDPAAVLKLADDMLYAAKKTGATKSKWPPFPAQYIKIKAYDPI